MRDLLSNSRFYHILFAVLLIPALLINLDAHHLFVHTDEGRRALVALEMILKNEYLAPTLNGEFYYQKPPLFNWILVASFKLFDSYSAFALRFPVVLFTLGFAWSIVAFLKPIMGNKKAWLVMAATVTSGRILFYDSFLGLIDIGLAVLVFANFMLFYSLGKQKRYFLLFALTYLLVAIGYMMKGLPSLVFQFFTIVAYAVYIKDWKFIFHKYNFLCTLIFIIPVGVYYYFYEQVNPGSFATVMDYTWFQSSQRTVAEHGIGETLLSMITFPLENMYHFAPWTLLLLALVGKGVIRNLWRNDFMRYAILVFAFNIWVYWTSPGVYPRYLFMFCPLLFAVLVEAYFTTNIKIRKWIDGILLAVLTVVAVAPIAVWFAPLPLNEVSLVGLKVAVLVTALALMAFIFWKKREYRLISLAIALLFVRIGFNWFVLPFKVERGIAYAAATEKVIEITEGSELYVLKPSHCHDANSFMISRARGEVLELREHPEPGNFYIIHEHIYSPEVFESYLSFGTRGTPQTLHLVKLR